MFDDAIGDIVMFSVETFTSRVWWWCMNTNSNNLLFVNYTN